MTEVKDLKLGRIFWIIWIAQYDHRVLRGEILSRLQRTSAERWQWKKDVMSVCWF